MSHQLEAPLTLQQQAFDKACTIAALAQPVRWPATSCSQCGCSTGPGNSGHSSCATHQPAKALTEAEILDLADDLSNAFAFNRERCKSDLSAAINAYAIQEFGAGWDAAMAETS
jgi:hypothetical protein